MGSADSTLLFFFLCCVCYSCPTKQKDVDARSKLRYVVAKTFDDNEQDSCSRRVKYHGSQTELLLVQQELLGNRDIVRESNSPLRGYWFQRLGRAWRERALSLDYASVGLTNESRLLWALGCRTRPFSVSARLPMFARLSCLALSSPSLILARLPIFVDRLVCRFLYSLCR